MDFLIFCLACFGLAFVLIDSKIFEGPRHWLADRSEFLQGLLSCYFCTAVWCAVFLVLLKGASTLLYTTVSWVMAGAMVAYVMSMVFETLAAGHE